ncbi:MAG: DNA topoisomerase IB [Actinobacteria bacterium]|nr:DNA topoisomerase IB [Actinomycetota bacterium]
MRLRRSDTDRPGIRRVRCGRGFRYVGVDGTAVRDEAVLQRIRALVIPPAWTQVWICTDPAGHLQAVGTDAAGRRQYRYHDEWRRGRDAAKHRRVLEFATALPDLRATTAEHLAQRGFGRERVLAGAARLIDLGLFRIGNEAYESAHNTFGVATLLRSHVRASRGGVHFSYAAKGSVPREQSITEPRVCRLVEALRRRSDPGPELFAYRDGRRWHDVTAADVNNYLQEITGGPWTAKDFRTWHATVLAAAGLAVSTHAADTPTARKRAVARTVREVAGHLGNTPAVARRSYIDPRVIGAYEQGVTVAPALGRLGTGGRRGEPATIGAFEAAVIDLIDRRQPQSDSPGGM